MAYSQKLTAKSVQPKAILREGCAGPGPGRICRLRSSGEAAGISPGTEPRSSLTPKHDTPKTPIQPPCTEIMRRGHAQKILQLKINLPF